MSAVVVSNGVPTETTRVFEPPQINQDNSRPRYLTCLGSFVTPEVMTQRPWTKGGGGIEIANPCLRYVRNFLRKGRITPLLRDTHDFLPYDFVKKTTGMDPLSAGYFAQQIPIGYEPPRLPPPNGQGALSGPSGLGGFSPYGSMVGKLALPGEQIDSILNGDDNVNRTNGNRKGVVEFTSLVGHEYRTELIRLENGATIDFDPDLWQIQRTIFPDYPNLPIKLDDIQALLDAAVVHTYLSPIVDTYGESLSQFRNYVDMYIQNVHQQMRERGPNGYVRPYTAGDLVLLDQLGMERQDRQALPSKDRLEGALEQLIALQIEEKKANLERMQRLESIGQTEAQISADTMAAAPIPQPVSTFPCKCGSYPKPGQTGSEAGLAAHKRQWCKLNQEKQDDTSELSA